MLPRKTTVIISNRITVVRLTASESAASCVTRIQEDSLHMSSTHCRSKSLEVRLQVVDLDEVLLHLDVDLAEFNS